MINLRFNRSVHVLAIGAILIGGALAAQAQKAQTQDNANHYPNQPVKIIVPFAAGGGADVVARIVAQSLGEALGQSVIVENRAGAGGSLGATFVAQSPPDGYRLLMGTVSTHGTNAAVYNKLGYDPVKDFAPIALVASAPLLLIAGPAAKVKSVADLVAAAKARPGELSFGSFGTGSINHLAAELFNSMAGIKTIHVPYRGSAPAMTDLIGGRIDFAFDGPTSLSYIQAGTVSLLGVANPTRWSVLPDRPTVSESGVPGFVTITWFGLFAPAGTPKPIVDLLNSKMNAALASAAAKEGLAKIGLEPTGGGPDVLAKTVAGDIKKWGDVAREKNIRAEQ
jgi:tripartite-type tricarboxylate transporter receptor subunit TctC